MNKMLDSITDGPRHPDEDAECLDGVKLQELSERYIEALDNDEKEIADDLREQIKDMFGVKYDKWGFWT